jgi:hypothetical protein
VPEVENVRSVVAVEQYVAGGESHVTPAHGSPLHAAFAHPLGHTVEVLAYAHVPLLHDPAVA